MATAVLLPGGARTAMYLGKSMTLWRWMMTTAPRVNTNITHLSDGNGGAAPWWHKNAVVLGKGHGFLPMYNDQCSRAVTNHRYVAVLC